MKLESVYFPIILESRMGIFKGQFCSLFPAEEALLFKDPMKPIQAGNI